MPPSPPPPPHTSVTIVGEKRNLLLGKSGWAIFGTHTLLYPRPPPSTTSPPTSPGCAYPRTHHAPCPVPCPRDELPLPALDTEPPQSTDFLKPATPHPERLCSPAPAPPAPVPKAKAPRPIKKLKLRSPLTTPKASPKTSPKTSPRAFRQSEKDLAFSLSNPDLLAMLTAPVVYDGPSGRGKDFEDPCPHVLPPKPPPFFEPPAHGANILPYKRPEVTVTPRLRS